MMYSKRRKNVGGRRKRSIRKSNAIRMRGGTLVDPLKFKSIDHLDNLRQLLVAQQESSKALYTINENHGNGDSDNVLLATFQENINNNIEAIKARIAELSSK